LPSSRPHWATHVEAAVGWAGLASAVWWLHAHTKDRGWTVDADILEIWKGEVAERTPLASDDLLDGAVDTQWFLIVYGALGEEHWDVLDGAAKYTSSSGGHTRARLFADALRGSTTDTELRTRIREKRQQDSVRALGLLPIPAAGREETILARYQEIQEYRREARAVRVGTAGEREACRRHRPREPGSHRGVRGSDPPGLGDGGRAASRTSHRAAKSFASTTSS
jgi:hypothetical protein